MSHINALPLRFLVALQCVTVRRRNEIGQGTTEYAVVILVAVALGMAVLTLFTSGAINGVIERLLTAVLEFAISKVH